MGNAKIGNWLLLSLIPSTILGVVLTVVLGALAEQNPDGSNTTATNVWAALWIVDGLYWWSALISGIVLKIIGSGQTKTLENGAVSYGEMHNWQQIAQTSWKMYRRNGVVLSVNPAFNKRAWILAIEGDGEHMTMGGFDRPRFALQFADWTWEHVMAKEPVFDPEAVRRSREQWDD